MRGDLGHSGRMFNLAALGAGANMIAVALGAVGTWLVWRHGLPASEVTAADSHGLMLESYDAKAAALARSAAAKRSRVGLLLLFASFVLQLISSVLSVIASP